MRYCGKIGYAVTKETKPGVWEEKIDEKLYFGDVQKNYARRSEGQYMNDNIQLSNTFSVVADAYAYDNFANMKYIEFLGVKWKINGVEAQHPRLIISTGGVYNHDEARCPR